MQVLVGGMKARVVVLGLSDVTAATPLGCHARGATLDYPGRAIPPFPQEPLMSTRRAALRLLAAIWCLVASGAGPAAAQVASSTPVYPRGIGSWNADSLGNRRAVVRVDSAAPAVRVMIHWRRHDDHPELKRVIVQTAAGARVTNAFMSAVYQSWGSLTFEPVAGPGGW